MEFLETYMGQETNTLVLGEFIHVFIVFLSSFNRLYLSNAFYSAINPQT